MSYSKNAPSSFVAVDPYLMPLRAYPTGIVPSSHRDGGMQVLKASVAAVYSFDRSLTYANRPSKFTMAQREEVRDRVRALCLTRKARKQQLQQLVAFEEGQLLSAGLAAPGLSKETPTDLASPANTSASSALSSDTTITEAEAAAWEEFSTFLNMPW